ncbi:hypothetical protein EDC01DRAFT_631166 [Geopyxis carbonaria]|nr:hypothetical protein EDC01DRAFT_631166 [Geopyxis carbonaria]
MTQRLKLNLQPRLYLFHLQYNFQDVQQVFNPEHGNFASAPRKISKIPNQLQHKLTVSNQCSQDHDNFCIGAEQNLRIFEPASTQTLLRQSNESIRNHDNFCVGAGLNVRNSKPSQDSSQPATQRFYPQHNGFPGNATQVFYQQQFHLATCVAPDLADSEPQSGQHGVEAQEVEEEKNRHFPDFGSNATQRSAPQNSHVALDQQDKLALFRLCIQNQSDYTLRKGAKGPFWARMSVLLMPQKRGKTVKDPSVIVRALVRERKARKHAEVA